MKKLVIAIAIAGLAACGGKAKKATTPDNKAPSGSMGGASYGGAMAPTNGSGSAGSAMSAPNPNHAADPCMGK